jgi:hypothetical protein
MTQASTWADIWAHAEVVPHSGRASGTPSRAMLTVTRGGLFVQLCDGGVKADIADDRNRQFHGVGKRYASARPSSSWMVAGGVGSDPDPATSRTGPP